MKHLRTQFLVALLLPFALILGGGIWGGTAQHTHRSADQGGVISWIPTGFIGCYAGTTPPTNTLEAYGQAVSRVTYPNLFSQIGTTYGAGDGVTTFNTPDTRGRVMVSLDNLGGTPANRITAVAADSLGGTGVTETISIAQLPAHQHNIQGYIDSLGAGTNAGFLFDGGGGGNNANSDMLSDSVGSGAAFNPPFLALKCVIGT